METQCDRARENPLCQRFWFVWRKGCRQVARAGNAGCRFRLLLLIFDI